MIILTGIWNDRLVLYDKFFQAFRNAYNCSTFHADSVAFSCWYYLYSPFFTNSNGVLILFLELPIIFFKNYACMLKTYILIKLLHLISIGIQLLFKKTFSDPHITPKRISSDQDRLLGQSTPPTLHGVILDKTSRVHFRDIEVTKELK